MQLGSPTEQSRGRLNFGYAKFKPSQISEAHGLDTTETIGGDPFSWKTNLIPVARVILLFPCSIIF